MEWGTGGCTDVMDVANIILTRQNALYLKQNTRSGIQGGFNEWEASKEAKKKVV